MKWRKLVPVSLACTFVAIGIVATFTPKPAAAETAMCGGGRGKLCFTYCSRQCTDGTCCDERYSYWDA